jgi:hypothetical protein
MTADTDEVEHVESYSTEAKANIRARVMRMRSLVRHIEQNGLHMAKKKLLAIYCLKEGISKSTAYSYLEEYMEAEIIVYDNGSIHCKAIRRCRTTQGACRRGWYLMTLALSWTQDEDRHLIDLREGGLTGCRLNTSFQTTYPARSDEAIKKHIQRLRRDRRVR